MTLIKIGSLKIEDKEEPMFSRGSKSKSHHRYKGNPKDGGENNKGEKQKNKKIKAFDEVNKGISHVNARWRW